MTGSCQKAGCVYMHFLYLIVLIVQLYSILKIRSDIRVSKFI